MNLFGFSPGELLLIMMVAMVVLGPEKLPEVAASLGKWIGEFRRATQELSDQFAADNPFAEIQRALQQVDQPAAAPASIAEAAVPVEEAAATLAAAVAAEPTFPPVPGTYARTAPAVVPSDYFSRPASYQAIDDAWTHGGVPEPDAHNGGRRWMAPVADEWAHGVPVVVESEPSPVVAEMTEIGELAETEPALAEAADGTSDPLAPIEAAVDEGEPLVAAGEAAEVVADHDADVREPEATPTSPALAEGRDDREAVEESPPATDAAGADRTLVTEHGSNGVALPSGEPAPNGHRAPLAVGAGDGVGSIEGDHQP